MMRCDEDAEQPLTQNDNSDDDEDDDDEDDDCDADTELVLRVVRDDGLGLGISVAGGVGTTGFKDGDEVSQSLYSLDPGSTVQPQA